MNRNDFAFQGYSEKTIKKAFNPMLLAKWEREAEAQAWIEYSELSGENDDFLQVYPVKVTTYHKEKVKK